MSEPQPVSDPLAPSATGIGSMPGSDIAEATRVVLGELTDLPHLPELPDRGAAASMTGRAVSLLADLGADLQPAGWRLTDAPGADQRRARSLLEQDLDQLEEQAQGYAGGIKVQVAGPWTLAATVDRPRGDRVLGDFGARRDLAQSLAEGVSAHVRDVQRRLGGCQVVVQVDEPALPAVLAGAVPTASGFSRHRSVTSAMAVEGLRQVLGAIDAAGGTPVVHCCASTVPVALLTEAGARALSVDATTWTPAHYDDYAAAVDAGVDLWLGVVPALEPETAPSAEELTRLVNARWRHLGFAEPVRCVITPTCGLAGATPQWARTALGIAATVAHNLTGAA